jgi:hypothetical protein
LKGKLFILIFALIFITVSIVPAEETVLNVNGRISRIKVYKDCLYVLNATENNIWRFGENLSLINKIGQQGLGPGEISRLSDFNFIEDKIYTFSSDSRLLVFDLQGNLLNESKLPDLNGSILLLKNGKVARRTRDFSYDRWKSIVYTVSFLDEKHNQFKKVLAEQLIIPPEYELEAVEPYIRVKYSEKAGRVFVSNPVHDYLIMIFDENGGQAGKIFKKDYDRVKASKAFQDRFLEALLNSPDKPPMMNADMIRAFFKTLHFPKYLPPFESFYLDDDGNVHVRTFKKKGQKTVFEKYSPGGRLIKEHLLDDRFVNMLDADLYIAFSESRFYYLYEDQKGEYILHSEKL